MKYIILALLVLAATANYDNIFNQQYKAFKAFQNWEQIYNKRYSSEEERFFRYTIFSEALERIKVLQEEDDDATYAATQFADIDPREFEEIYLGYRLDLATDRTRKEFERTFVSPDAWDWTEHGAVTDIKDQGQCGSCWAFSTCGALEGQNSIQHQQSIQLAEQELVDCDNVDQGCNGGLMDNAFTWLIQNGGMMKQDDYPYTAKEGTCQFDKEKVVVKVADFEDIKKGDEARQKEALYSEGPLSVALNASSLQYYSGGVFNPKICMKAQLNHGVTLVGYGKDTEKKQLDFWRVKNSWGKTWGEKGYFRIMRGKNKCGIANASTIVHIV